MGKLAHTYIKGEDIITHVWDAKAKRFRSGTIPTRQRISADKANANYERDAEGRLRRRPATLPASRRGKGGGWVPFQRREAAE